MLIRPTVMVVFDSVRDEMVVVTPVRPAAGVSARAAYESAQARLDAVVAALEGPLDHVPPAVDPTLLADKAVSNTSEAEFLAMVAKAKDYIVAGDAFQIVLSQRFTSRFDLPAFSLYRALRRVNPSPYLCFLDFGGFQIVVSSPEILVRVRERQGRASARSPARAGAARRRPRTPRSPPSCSPTPRSAPSI